jgi:C1A family cysteine protease
VATAKDAAGNSATNSISVSQNVVSADVTAPAVSITSPASGSSVSGTVSVSVNASDNVGVKSVTLSVDGTIVSTLTATPYNFSWNTTNVADGNHSVSAKATDAAGNTNTSTITVAKNTTITTLPSGSLPSTVSLIMPPVSNQGAEGCCIAFAAGYYARSCEQYYHTNATSYNNTTNIFSPEYLFNQTKSSLDCNGSSVINTLDFLVNNGICSWQSMPYTSGSCNLLPTTTQNSEASTYKIKSYSTIFTSDLIAIKTLLSQKHPLLLGISTDQQFDNAGPGFIWSSYGSATTSLHEVTICGYDDSKQAFRIVNSWGTNWGDSGYSWISYNFLPMLNNYVFAMNI